jgi:periplasmic protein TonB
MANIFELDNQKFERDSKRKGFLTSLIIHGALLGIFALMLTLEAPNPPIGGGGILVNFGTSDVGSGDVQPMNDNGQKAITNPPPSASASSSSPDKDQKVVTQDVEDAPVINQSNTKTTAKKHTKITKKIPVNTTNTTPTKTTKVNNNPPTPPAPTVDQRAMYKGAKGTPNTSTSEGTDKVPGDKGMPTGDPNGRSYTGISTGSGGGNGNGIGNGQGDLNYNLSGRSMLPLIVTDNSQKGGVVVVAITVDRNGNVIEANYSVAGSTTNDDYLVDLAVHAAYQAKFSDANIAEQRGSMTFRFKFK